MMELPTPPNKRLQPTAPVLSSKSSGKRSAPRLSRGR